MDCDTLAFPFRSVDLLTLAEKITSTTQRQLKIGAFDKYLFISFTNTEQRSLINIIILFLVYCETSHKGISKYYRVSNVFLMYF